ncbi:MAG: methylated-DNA--[protein]-cysteine S-methyltransferase [Candidatus Aminicenantia bacterium]
MKIRNSISKIFYILIDFPLGKIFLSKTQNGLCLIKFLGDYRSQNSLSDSVTELTNFILEQNDQAFSQEKELFSSYFNGERVDFSQLKIDFIFGTKWQKKVWRETRRIPYGETRSYKFIAQEMNIKGYQCIGQALGKNPLLIVIPCHRVVKTDRSIGGFSAGVELKKYLLELENISFLGPNTGQN